LSSVQVKYVTSTTTSGRTQCTHDSFRGEPKDPVARGEEYRKTGWSTFDDKAPPYRPNHGEIDRIRADWPS
jgi:hypothetical protein